MCGFDGSFIFMKGKGIRLVYNIAIFNELKVFFCCKRSYRGWACSKRKITEGIKWFQWYKNRLEWNSYINDDS